MIQNSDDSKSVVRPRTATSDIANMKLMNSDQWQEVGNAFSFTYRERQVCEHLFLGATRDEIADSIKIKTRTVRHHMENIHRKMNVKNRVGVVLRVIETRDLLDE